jgi:hypothetical protein
MRYCQLVEVQTQFTRGGRRLRGLDRLSGAHHLLPGSEDLRTDDQFLLGYLSLDVGSPQVLFFVEMGELSPLNFQSFITILAGAFGVGVQDVALVSGYAHGTSHPRR